MKRILALAILALLAFACSKEDNAPEVTKQQTNGQKTIFYASMEGQGTPGTGTKVYADENLNLLWNENDSITIFNKRTLNVLYIFAGEDGDNSGEFEEVPYSGFATGNNLDHIYAVYPYASGTKINNDGTNITLNLPSTQAYREHSFGVGANTMVAVTDDYFLGFKNVCGYLKFRFYGDNVKVKSIILEGNNGEKIAGKAVVSPSMNANPTVLMDETATESITLNCPQPVTIGTSNTDYTEFIFVVPPTTFSGGFKVTVIDSDGGVFEKSSTRSLTISRNKMESMGAMEVIPTGGNGLVIFEDDNFKAYCVENFDADGDGEISFNEAKEVTRMSFYTDENHWNISSLKGIEAFQNLTYLRCRGYNSSSIGKLTSLDISKNTELDTLECYNNQLTSLDVSNNTALTNLYCYSNQLTSLDVSNNTALTDLSCYSNQLTSLDVSNNTSLTSLSCTSNQLTSLDVSHNTALTGLYCYSNQLTCLDLSHNTALTGLYCQNNKLSSLDLSHNAYLRYLNCEGNQLVSLDLSNNTVLFTMYCNSNQLTNLDLSYNTTLNYLHCDNNQLTFLNVNNNTALKGLYCYNNQLTILDVSKNTALTFLSAWPQNGTLATLVKRTGQQIQYKAPSGSSYVTIDPSDYGTTIAEVGSSLIVQFDDANFKAYCVSKFDTNRDGEISIDEAKEVSRMEFHTDENHQNIASLKGIEEFINLTYLDCAGWDNSNLGKLTSLDLSKNTALTELHCGWNQLTSLDVSGCTALTILYCQSNKLSILDVSHNTALTELGCPSNQLTSLDLSHNTALTDLWFGANQLTSLDLSNNTALTHLDCQNNKLTSLDLSHNSALQWLDCFTNRLTSLIVGNNNALTYLDCHSNQLTSLDVSQNTSLTGLYCYSNQLTSLDISNNTVLKNLYCYSNQLTSLDISNNTALESLRCYSNRLTSLDVSKTSLGSLYAWPQSGTLSTLVKKTGQSINYYNSSNSSITPSDYGTTIVEVD